MAEIELPNPEELEELREKAFTRRTALVTALYAVCLAIVSLAGNREKAHELERERDAERARDPYFDFGEVLLQIGIVLASMSILTRARPIFAASVLAALAGVALGLNGFLQIVRLPFL